MHKTLLSVILVVFNMRREAPRTLFTLSSTYQGMEPSLYEVIVVENGSTDPLLAEEVERIGSNFRYINFDAKTPSPAAAINEAVRASNGLSVGILIDGARMLSPRLLHYALIALNSYNRPLISSLGCHLGYKPQQESVLDGYNQEVEDDLLSNINWESDGYRLFEISSLAGSSKYGIYAPLAESNAVFMPRQMFDELAGYDERFISPGGGLVNLDFYQRAQSLNDVNLVTLLGEATFHQFHGGVTTQPQDNWTFMAEEYQLIREKEFEAYPTPLIRTDYVGQIRESFLPWLDRAVSERENLFRTLPSQPYHQDSNQFKTVETTVISILGMHRSGTSLLAGTLQEAGLFLGDVVNKAPHNKKGNRESLPIRELHEDLLHRSGGSWDNPPQKVVWEVLHRTMRDLIIRGFEKQFFWGFKDPRSLFCLEGWLEVLPNMKCVGIVRHPEEVAMSLSARNGWPLESGIQLWYLYNKRLLHWHEILGFPIISFGQNVVDFKFQAQNLIEKFNLPNSTIASNLKFYEPTLCNQTSGSLSLSRDVENLYNELLDRVNQTQKDCTESLPNNSSKGWRFHNWSWWRTIKNL